MSSAIHISLRLGPMSSASYIGGANRDNAQLGLAILKIEDGSRVSIAAMKRFVHL